ncbi:MULTISPECIES: DUF2783 domain-containing protein [Pseudomonas]|uniref:DUF2783 domain-containing protein n=1 Tax=Pseudomonas TaxID=286 RepID=UPI000D00229A|nr:MULTISPECIES: DUF2783 domain-containing protein [Pseudomonas]PRA56952.1 DUF2783 domain-containing protein [Pseudomonas sp. MYb115]QXN47695.1 DUF2783 domain-containing protein [Pseudomonas fluorescens]WSO21999.1 DUF2783 domain-containing protein [Pseudomonas fluorescens]
MNKPQLSITDVEQIYDHLAETLDQIAEDQRQLFLVKLALLSARKIGEGRAFLELTRQAALDL